MRNTLALSIIFLVLVGCGSAEEDNASVADSCPPPDSITPQDCVLEMHVSKEEDLIKVCNSPCTTLKGDLTITPHMSIIDASIFKKLKSIDGYITISTYDGPFKSTKGFDNLKDVGSIQITSSLGLEAIEGFPELETVGSDINFYANRNVKVIRGFRKLKQFAHPLGFDGMKIHEHSSLETIDAFDSVERGRAVNIYQNKSLKEIKGFHSLKTTRNLQITTNPQLVTIDGFEALEEVTNRFTISGNTMLPDCVAETIASRVPETPELFTDQNNPACPDGATNP